MNTRTQPALTESASNGLRPPVDGSIILGGVDPGTGIDPNERREECRRRCYDGDRGCSVLWQGVGGSAHFKRRQTRQLVSTSQDAQEVAWGAGGRRDCAWQALQPFAVSLQPDAPEPGSTGGAKVASGSRLGANQMLARC